MEYGDLILYWLIFGGSLAGVAGTFFVFLRKFWKRLWSGKPKKTVIISQTVIGIITLGIFIWAAPVTANVWFYRGVLLHLPYMVVPVISVFLFIYAWNRKFGASSNSTAKKAASKAINGSVDDDGDLDLNQVIKNLSSMKQVTGRRLVILGLLVIILNIFWFGLANNIFEWSTYHLYAKSAQRDNMIVPQPDGLRYTPREVAFVDLENYISLATEDTVIEYTRPIFTKGKFGYVTPIMPDGIPSVFTKMNPGFLYFDDSRARSQTTTESMVDRHDQVFECGEGMYWLDNLQRQAYLEDFMAVYEKAHYVDVSKPDEEIRYVAIMPKIKYHFFMFPYWAGAVVVDQECNTRDLTVAELKTDPILSKVWVAPIELARHYVEIQNYAAGFMAGFSFWRVDGKLEIPPLPGHNQFPHIQVNESGGTDFLVVTKAEGGGSGMYRAYYFDASTFKMTHYEFPQKGKGKVYGPSAALQRIPNVPGYNWYRKSESGVESGNVIAIEPVFVPREDGAAFWKFTITNMDKAGVSGAAVANASNPKDIISFSDRQRPYYESWLRGGEVSKEQMLRDAIQAIENALKEAQSELSNMQTIL